MDYALTIYTENKKTEIEKKSMQNQKPIHKKNHPLKWTVFAREQREITK